MRAPVLSVAQHSADFKTYLPWPRCSLNSGGTRTSSEVAMLARWRGYGEGNPRPSFGLAISIGYRPRAFEFDRSLLAITDLERTTRPPTEPPTRHTTGAIRVRFRTCGMASRHQTAAGTER